MVKAFFIWWGGLVAFVVAVNIVVGWLENKDVLRRRKRNK